MVNEQLLTESAKPKTPKGSNRKQRREALQKKRSSGHQRLHRQLNGGLEHKPRMPKLEPWKFGMAPRLERPGLKRDTEIIATGQPMLVCLSAGCSGSIDIERGKKYDKKCPLCKRDRRVEYRQVDHDLTIGLAAMDLRARAAAE